jgi:protein gp37
MGRNSKISWTHDTWNPWWGCTEVSEACDFCYAREFAEKKNVEGSRIRVEWGKGKPRFITSEHNRNEIFRYNREARKFGSRRLVFTASMADIFDPEVPIEWFAEAFDRALRCVDLDIMALTKRPQIIRSRIAEALPTNAGTKLDALAAHGRAFIHDGKPFPNIRFGTTLELQRYMPRLLSLCDLPAHLLFVSAEPLLGPLNFRRALMTPNGWVDFLEGKRYVTDPRKPGTLDGVIRIEPLKNRIGQVIVGGESGEHKFKIRPMHPAWPLSILKQCRDTNTAFFFKQWGEWIPAAFAEQLGINLANDCIERWRFTDETALARVSFGKRNRIDDLLIEKKSDGGRIAKRYHEVPGYSPLETPEGPKLVSHGFQPFENYFPQLN